MYIKEIKIFFDRIKLITSYENAEKVVKDPSKPIIKKNLTKFSDILFPNLEVMK